MTGATRQARLALATELPVLGVVTRFETNDAGLLSLVEETFGGWRGIAPDTAIAGIAPLVRIVVHEGDEGATRPIVVRHLLPDARRLVMRSPGSTGVCDPAAGRSVARVTPALLADRALFRDAVLEALTLALLSSLDRHPLHAAAVARGGRALLLAGGSGSGKSTLAWLAHRAGLDVLGEDRVWVQLAPRLRVWGWPGAARLLPDAARRFPEVAASAAPDADGKLRVAMPARGRGSRLADGATVCLLSRGADAPRLERLDESAIGSALVGDVPPGFDRWPARHARVAATLARGGGWRLTLGPDPHEALPLLERMLVG